MLFQVPLRGEEQMALQCPAGVDLRHDHGWQLHLSVARARRALGMGPHAGAARCKADSRSCVRKAFSMV